MTEFGFRDCLQCGLSFQAKRKAQKFCREECRFKWHAIRFAKAREIMKGMEQ